MSLDRRISAEDKKAAVRGGVAMNQKEKKKYESLENKQEKHKIK